MPMNTMAAEQIPGIADILTAIGAVINGGNVDLESLLFNREN